MHGKPIFVGMIHVKRDAPRFHIAPTYEIEHPFRLCKRSLIIRLRKTTAVVIGLWRKNKTSETDILLRAVQGHTIGKQDGESGDLSGESE